MSVRTYCTLVIFDKLMGYVFVEVGGTRLSSFEIPLSFVLSMKRVPFHKLVFSPFHCHIVHTLYNHHLIICTCVYVCVCVLVVWLVDNNWFICIPGSVSIQCMFDSCFGVDTVVRTIS